MTSAHQGPSPASVVEVPWYDLIDDPEPPEDGMQQEITILEVMSILQARYEHDPTVLCVSALVNVIYDSHARGSVISPDGFIVFGVQDARVIKWERRSYRIEEWGRTPSFVLEVASQSTAPKDLNEKRDIYAGMGVQEYWRLDRRGEYYGERLVGESLVDEQYQRFELHTDPNGDAWSRSDVLGVEFVYHQPEQGFGRFLLRDAVTGEWLNTLWEEQQARREAEERTQRAEAASEERALREQELRRAAEAESEELREEIRRIRDEQAGRPSQ